MKGIETTYPVGREVVMTLAERFREEGKEEGAKESMEKVAKNQSSKAFPQKTLLKLLDSQKKRLKK